MAKKEKSAQTQQGLPKIVKVGVAAGAVFAAAALGGGCKNETNPDPKVCECPNGTIHDATKDMPCCEGENCTCKQKFEYPNAFLGVKVVVENQTGRNVIEPVGVIKKYFDDYGNLFVSEAGNLNTRGGVLTILIETDAGSYTADGYRIVNSTTFATSYEFLTTNENTAIITMLAEGILNTADSSNAKVNVYNNIRLANGKTLNVGEAIALGRQFSDAKKIVRAAFQSQRQA